VKARFLSLLAEHGTFRAAIIRLGRTRTSAYVERAADADFALAWDRALDCEFEAMQTRLTSRALGVPEAVMLPGPMRAEDLLAIWILSNLSPPAAPVADSDKPTPREMRSGGRRTPGAAKGAPAPGAAARDATDPESTVGDEAARIEALIADVAARVAAAEQATD
jgi:hypothetical protein